MEILGSWNVTVEAIHAAGEVYNFANQQLAKANVALPEFDYILSVLTSILGFVLTHSPAAVRQLYTLFTKLPLLEYNFVTTLFIMVLFYTFYCLVTAAMRWVRGLIFGFVRFSVIIFIIYGAIYLFQTFTSLSPTNSSQSSTRTKFS
ncbi:hypothetical protein BY458DRAFT_525175 [Sporodiniella umbellata]|nr:hypothetical protein BY458DRAFT_525175 [Sporodiniella umbellata]